MFSGVSSRFAAAITGARAIEPCGMAWRGLLFAAALGISGCSTNNVLNLRPDVDVGTTAGLPRNDGMQDLVADDPYLRQADAAPQAEELSQDDPAQQDAMSEPDPDDPAPPEQSLGQATIEPGYPAMEAVSQPSDIAQAGGSTEMDIAPDAGEEVAMAGQQPMSGPFEAEPPPRPRAGGVVLAGYPRMNEPDTSGPEPMPADEVSCRRELKKLGVVYRELSPIHDSASCRIDHPIKVSVLPGNVGLKPAATLNCEMALTFAKWTKNELNPAARRRYWSRVKTIHQMSSYSCRRINGSHSMSEHSKGNALDVGRIELTNGKDIDVEKPGFFSFRTKRFLNTVRADGCDYFTTVLGPGYNWDHRNHFHFDVKPRRNGRHACH
jgi:hypothetical protein